MHPKKFQKNISFQVQGLSYGNSELGQQFYGKDGQKQDDCHDIKGIQSLPMIRFIGKEQSLGQNIQSEVLQKFIEGTINTQI